MQQMSNSEDFIISPKRRKADHIPNDIAISILAKLPLKSLSRFSCVSKTWNSLFRTPEFISEHKKNHNSGHLVYISPERICILLGGSDGLEKFKYVFFPLNNYVVAGVCHGLILIASRKNCAKEIRLDFDSRPYLVEVVYHLYYIWNPVTGILKSIGGWEVAQPADMAVGFGYSGRRGDYRAIRMSFKEITVTSPGLGCRCRWSYTMEVYSMAADRWTSVERCCDRRPLSWEHIVSESVFFRGSVYFLGKSWETAGYMIMRFDLDEEVFNEIALPPTLESDPDILRWQLAVVGGDRLGLLHARHEEGGDRKLHMTAWLLNKESTSWTARTHCFQLPETVFFVNITSAGLLIMEERTARGERRRLFTYAYDANDIDLELRDLQSSVIAAGTFSSNPTSKQSCLISINKESLFLINRGQIT